MKLTRNQIKTFVISLAVYLFICYLIDVLFDMQIYQYILPGAVIALTTNYNRQSTIPKKQ